MRPEDPQGPTPVPEAPKLANIVALLVGSLAVVVSPFLTWSTEAASGPNISAVRRDAFDIPLAWLFKWPWPKVPMCESPSTLKLGHALLACGIVGVIAALIGVALLVAQPGPSVDLQARAKAWRVVGLVGEVFLLLALALVFDLIFQVIPWGSRSGRDLLSHPGLWVAGVGAIVGSSAPRARRKTRTQPGTTQ